MILSTALHGDFSHLTISVNHTFQFDLVFEKIEGIAFFFSISTPVKF